MLTQRPVGLDEIIHTFGNLDDPQFEARSIVLFNLPYPLLFQGTQVKRAQCHRLIVENFQKAFEDLKAAGPDAQVKNYCVVYARLSIRGFGSHPSTHSWGIAVDLEADKFPLGSANRFPDEIVKIFQNAGFFYGGDFLARKDPMHFQFCKVTSQAGVVAAGRIEREPVLSSKEPAVRGSQRPLANSKGEL